MRLKMWWVGMRSLCRIALLGCVYALALSPANALDIVVSKPSTPPSRSVTPVAVDPFDLKPRVTQPEGLIPADKVFTLVIVGDTGLNGTMQPVRADGALRHGRRIPWKQVTAGIAEEINGDFNLANLETVVLDSNRIRSVAKRFNFRSHPAGIRHLVRTGFNLFGTANNHSADFGVAGIRATLRHLDAMRSDGLLAHAGLGKDRLAAGAPRMAEVRGARVLLSAVGIGGFRAGDDRPGQLAYRSKTDFAEVTRRLGSASGDFRILSVHYGAELAVRAGSNAIGRFRDLAIKQHGIDLVVGHHAHVPAGVARVDNRFIFFGLGNFLHQGMQDMAKFGICRNYGLMARLHMQKVDKGRLVVRAVEAIPVTNMHASPKRLSKARSREHVHVLNHLARHYDDPRGGMKGVRFSPQIDGTGLFCAPGAQRLPGPIGERCRAMTPLSQPSAALARRIRGSCSGRYARSRPAHRYRRTASKQRSKRRARRIQCTAFFGFCD